MQLIRKAIAAALVGFVGWLGSVTVSPAASITSGEWVQLAAVAVGAVLVWLVPNEPAPLDAGQTRRPTLLYVLVVLALILLVLWLLGVPVRLG